MGHRRHTQLRQGSADASRAHRPSDGAGQVQQCSRGGDGVIERQLDLADQVVAMCDDSAAAEVTVRTGQHALTRFANSFIHQNVAEDVATVSLRLSYDGASASASMSYDPTGP